MIHTKQIESRRCRHHRSRSLLRLRRILIASKWCRLKRAIDRATTFTSALKTATTNNTYTQPIFNAYRLANDKTFSFCSSPPSATDWTSNRTDRRSPLWRCWGTPVTSCATVRPPATNTFPATWGPCIYTENTQLRQFHGSWTIHNPINRTHRGWLGSR